MSPTHPQESEEWVTARIVSWVGTYRTSMLTAVILRLLSPLGGRLPAGIDAHLVELPRDGDSPADPVAPLG